MQQLTFIGTNPELKGRGVLPLSLPSFLNFRFHAPNIVHFALPVNGISFPRRHLFHLTSSAICTIFKGEMNRLPISRKVQILTALTEGASVRSVSRMTGAHIVTILRLLGEAGDKAKALMDAKIRDIRAKEIQCDEIWGFVGKKDKRLNGGDGASLGSQFVFVAIEARTKLVPTFVVGKRNLETATRFMLDLRKRVAGRVQITTDAFPVYADAVEVAFGVDCDYAMLIKSYASNGYPKSEGYVPSDFMDTKPITITGNPDPKKISTSYIERTMRMSMRRLTRLTNGFSKKLENLKAALALHFAWYNFGRVHQTLRVTPAMAAGITGHIWTWEEILVLRIGA